MFCVEKGTLDEVRKANEKVFEEMDQRNKMEKKIKAMNYPAPEELFSKLNIDRKTFASILEYFLKENMILIDNDHIVWIHNPKLNKLLHKKGYVIL